MSKFMLIGGGEVGRGNTTYETQEIDVEVVKMTEKEEPNFLFVGLASSYSDSYYDTMKKIYKELGCTCSYLKKKNIINNPDIVKNKILSADIIYFCGGDTIKLVEDITYYNLLPLIQEAIAKDTVIVGMSAGAIMLCKEGYSDSKKLRGESDYFEFIPGFNILDISFCPHYVPNEQRAKELENDLQKNPKTVLALQNGVALKIIDNNKSIIKSNKDNKAYLCSYENNKYIEKELNYE